MPEIFYHRPELAARLSKLIIQVSVGSSASSGVFLAAPRRTGKSTFAREDLRPALEKAGAIVLYADLWQDLTKDPGLVIVEAIREAVGRNDGFITRLAKASGIDKVAVGGLNFSLDKIGLGKDIDLTTALVALSDESQKLIVLMIDEAQHAITTEAGVAALFALKAARDELNSSRHHGLRIVCTGSNRDKLAMLRNSKDQAFFGASMVPFPTLDQNYIDWLCANIDLPSPLDPAEVFQLFKESGYRPELLGAAADAIRFDFFIDPENVRERFAELVRAQADELNANLKKVIHSLTPIQSAVIRVMGSMGDNFAPFEAPTMALYATAMKQAGIPESDIKVEVPGVQQALIALQEKNLVWKASRGVYAVDEHVIVDLLRADGLLKGL
ncbi:ATP-binding protein [Pseudomonas sp. Ps21-P2]|uniref:ATP-binding protein n=1 Tax=Pseudomonas sp. Ps21-P2 TaxID=3080331 RepID=UPI0032096521